MGINISVKFPSDYGRKSPYPEWSISKRTNAIETKIGINGMGTEDVVKLARSSPEVMDGLLEWMLNRLADIEEWRSG